jgi:predicted Rossmann-fold nucleotide-binding protein
MKLIIAGGRDYQLTDADYDSLDELLSSLPIQEVVHGGATGADECGEAWAKLRGIPVHPPFKADWYDLTKPDAIIKTDRNGRKYDAYAGPRRNKEMAAYADAVALFPGGDGTASMYRAAKGSGIEIYDFRIMHTNYR